MRKRSLLSEQPSYMLYINLNHPTCFSDKSLSSDSRNCKRVCQSYIRNIKVHKIAAVVTIMWMLWLVGYQSFLVKIRCLYTHNFIVNKGM